MKNKYGIQITSSRIGLLEKKMLKYILDLPKSSIGLDLGSGNGYISMLVSLLHKNIFSYDIKQDWKLYVFKILFNVKKLHLYRKDLKEISFKDIPTNIDFVYSARFLHYLSYNEAKKLLSKISKRMKKNGKVFLTVSGLNSDIGKSYNGKDKDISTRHSFLSKGNQKRFNIKQKVTLYTKTELEDLVRRYLDIEESWESDFKNVFIIAKKK